MYLMANNISGKYIPPNGMQLFINDKLIHIVKQEDFFNSGKYDLVLDAYTNLSGLKLYGDVLILDGHSDHIDELLALMEDRKLKKLNSITYVTGYYKGVKDFIKSQFKIIKAGGGLVMKDGKYLMIYRLGKWDLPKGKLEKDETPSEGALREVEEECGIRAQLDVKLCSTWHTYLADGRKTIKKTTWYLMDCLNDTKMVPQKEEDIDEVRWMTKAETELALGNSYASIKAVFAAYSDLIKV
jgi:8-oxo-(d)GTP phosphatase